MSELPAQMIADIETLEQNIKNTSDAKVRKEEEIKLYIECRKVRDKFNENNLFKFNPKVYYKISNINKKREKQYCDICDVHVCNLDSHCTSNKHCLKLKLADSEVKVPSTQT